MPDNSRKNEFDFRCGSCGGWNCGHTAETIDRLADERDQLRSAVAKARLERDCLGGMLRDIRRDWIDRTLCSDHFEDLLSKYGIDPSEFEETE